MYKYNASKSHVLHLLHTYKCHFITLKMIVATETPVRSGREGGRKCHLFT